MDLAIKEHLKLRETKQNQSKPETGINRVLQTLTEHGFLVRFEVKKEMFKEKFWSGAGQPRLFDYTGLRETDFRETHSRVEVYSFHADIMLHLKARLFEL